MIKTRRFIKEEQAINTVSAPLWLKKIRFFTDQR
jgi:hypothetical protein